MSLTGTGLITGTPAYLAPEVARGGESGPASDVYSLGATLYAAVEGVPPFQADDNVFRMLQLVAAGQVPPPRQAGELEPVLRRLMHPDPAQRPDAAQAREMLRGVLDGRPPVPVAAPGQAAPISALTDRVVQVTALVAVVVAIMVFAALLAVSLA
jgi:serine/threonine protein kinase